MRTPFPKSILAAAIAVSVCAPSFAEDDVVDVNTIVVTGTATGGLDTLVTQEDLNKTQASTLSDVFRNEPDVNASGAVSLSQKLYVRDLGEDVINISVDGAEQATGVFHHTGRVAIEPELLKQVEVEAGAGSATAGLGALGGSVRFTTKDAADLLDEDKNIGALFKSTYSSNGEGLKNSAIIYGRTDNDVLSGIFSLVDSDLDTLVDGDGDDIAGTATEKFLGYGKVVLQPNDEHRLSLSYENLTEETETARRPEWAAISWNPVLPYEGERETIIANYNFNSNSNDAIDIDLTVYQTKHDLYSEEYDFTGAVESTGGTLQNTSLVGNHELIYGANYRQDISESTEGYDEEGTVWGVYLQDIYYATDSLTVTAGARFDQYLLEDWQGQEFDNSGLSPNVSANYALTSAVSVSAGYAKALRGAQVTDAYNLGGDYNDEDLTAEVAHNVELGVNYTIENLTLASGVYYTIIQDAIVEDYEAGEFSNLGDDINAAGFYANSELKAGGLTVGANLKLVSTKIDDEYLSRYVYGSTAASTGHSLGINLDYEFSEKLQVGWGSLFVMGVDEFENSAFSTDLTVEKPGYMVHDLYANWKPFNKHDLNLSLRVNNLFDEQYLDHTSTEDFEGNATFEGIIGNYEPGRDIRVTASYKL